MRSAVMRRTRVSGCSQRPSAPARGSAAGRRGSARRDASTSSCVIRPPGPVPWSVGDVDAVLLRQPPRQRRGQRRASSRVAGSRASTSASTIRPRGPLPWSAGRRHQLACPHPRPRRRKRPLARRCPPARTDARWPAALRPLAASAAAAPAATASPRVARRRRRAGRARCADGRGSPSRPISAISVLHRHGRPWLDHDPPQHAGRRRRHLDGCPCPSRPSAAARPSRPRRPRASSHSATVPSSMVSPSMGMVTGDRPPLSAPCGPAPARPRPGRPPAAARPSRAPRCTAPARRARTPAAAARPGSRTRPRPRG